MIPEVKIYYSDIYDAFVRDLQKKKYSYSGYKARRRSGFAFAKKLSTKTKFLLPKALKVYENVSGLEWKDPLIEVFVLHDIKWAFSFPVTINVVKDKWNATETLLHELSHQIVIQNEGKFRWKNKFSQKYKKEHFVVLEHILPHAILWKAYEKLFGVRKLKNIIKGYTRWKWHYRAWQIVKEEGADKIIKAYVR